MWPFYVFLFFRPVLADSDNKNMVSPCEVILNEVSLSKRFVELGKLCVPPTFSKHTSLSRHNLFIVDEDRILRFKYSFKNKQILNLDPLPNESGPRQTIKKLRKGSQPKTTATTKAPKARSNGKHQTTRAMSGNEPTNAPIVTVHEDIGAVPCQDTFYGCGDDSKFLRKKRDVSENQPYVRGLFVVNLEGLNFVPSHSYGIYLIRLPTSQDRIGLTSFKVGQVLPQDQQEFISANFHDYLLITPPNTGQDLSSLTDLLPKSVPVRFLVLKEDTSEYSFSKCDKDISPGGMNGFIHAKPTKGLRNVCQSYKEPQPFGFKGKTLRPQSKEFIINVISNLNRLIDSKDWQGLDIVRASARLLNLSPDTLYNVINEYSEKQVFAPAGKRVRFSPVTDIDEEKKQLIYTTIVGYYKRDSCAYFKNVFRDWVKGVREIQLQKIEQQKQNGEDVEELYHCGARSFGKILKKQGYKYGKLRDRDSQIFRPKNIELRKSYLKLKLKYDKDPNWDIVYQDETWYCWIDTHARSQKGWRLKRFESFIQRREFAFDTAKISRGARLIVLAVGGENGFVPGTSEVFVVINSKRKVKKVPAEQDVQLAKDTECQDYHMNVDGDRFFKWIEKVLRALTRPTAIVMDNCSTHKVNRNEIDFFNTLPDILNPKRILFINLNLGMSGGDKLMYFKFDIWTMQVRAYPGKSSTKPVMLQWLQQQKLQNTRIDEDISDTTSLTRTALLTIIDRIVKEKKLLPTKIQQLVENHGHKILLTPPYQPELQPIEYVWADIKREVRENNNEQTVAHAKLLTNRAISTYPTEKWRSHIRHVLKVQEEFIEGDKEFEFSETQLTEERTAEPLGPVEITIIDVFAGTIVDDVDDDEDEQ